MKEFTISFRYNNESHKAGVLRKVKVKKIEYDVRPLAPVIVRRFGQQIRIIKEQGNFSTGHPVGSVHLDFFHDLVDAIKCHEDGEPAYKR